MNLNMKILLKKNKKSKSKSKETDFYDNESVVEFGGIAIPEELSYLRDNFFGEPFAFKGFPSAQKCSPIIEFGYLFGIFENSTHKDEAWNIIKQSLSDDFQRNVGYLPVKRSVFKEKLEINRGSNITDEDIDSLEKLAGQASTLLFSDETLIKSINENLLDFVNNEKSAEETAESIQKKVNIYLNERK